MSETKLKLGSLFDGIGGFPIVGQWYDIEPTWASEIEEPCIRITKKHFPNMKHLGDITKIHGDQIEPVDVITGGSPCQDLSCAGKQSGIKLKCENCGTLVEFADNTQKCPNCGTVLDFTRSGLFMEQIRIIREMREKTNNQYPRFSVWENVCFEGNTLITCESGFKAIRDVYIGDKVKTLSGQYLPVVKCHKTKYQKVVRLEVSGSEDVIVTEKSSFLCNQKISQT